MTTDQDDVNSARATIVHSSLARGLWLAFALSIAFLVVSAVQSAGTFLSRIVGSSMTAATRAVWSGQAARDVAFFFAAQIMLHLAFGMRCLVSGLGHDGHSFLGQASGSAGSSCCGSACSLRQSSHTTQSGIRGRGWAILPQCARHAAGPTGDRPSRSIWSSSQLQRSRCRWPGGKRLRRLGLARLRLPLGIGGALLAVALVSALAAVHGPRRRHPGSSVPTSF